MLDSLETPSLPSSHEVRQGARRAARKSAPWVEGLGRLGHAAHGLVYATVGLLAAQAAVGAGGSTTDLDGVLAWIMQAPLGSLLLAGMALGLLCYAGWRFIQAAGDTEDKGSSPRGLLARAGFVGSGVVHLTLAVSALQFSLMLRRGPDHDPAQEWTARVLVLPFGQWLIVIAGIVVIGVAMGQGFHAFRVTLREGASPPPVHPSLECWLERMGRLGYAAKFVVLLIIGGFLIRAAIEQNPGQAHGFGGTMATIGDQPFGSGMLLAVATGMMIYGIYELAEAWYRPMNLEEHAQKL